MKILLVVLLFLTTQYIACELIFSSGEKFKCVLLDFGGIQRVNVTGSVTSSLDNSFGKILISERTISFNLEASIQQMVKNLPLGVILIGASSYEAGTERLWLDCPSCFTKLGIPLYAIDRVNGLSIVQRLNNGTLVSDAALVYEKNNWEVAAQSGLWTAGQVIIAAMSACLVIFSIHRLASFIMIQGFFDLSVAQTAALILMAAGVGDLICWIPDPWFSRGYYPYNFWALFGQIPGGMISIAVITVMVYWLELLTCESIVAKKFAKKFALPFIIFAACYALFVLIISITRSFLPQSPALSLFPLIVASIVNLAFCAFYWAVGIKLIMFLKSKKSEKLKKVSAITILSGIVLVFRVVVSWASGVGGFLNIAPGFFAIAWIVEFLSLLLGLLLILSFEPKNKKYVATRASTRSASASSQSSRN